MEHILNIVLPQALVMGVEYDLFWTLNPKSLQPFAKAFELSQRNNDILAWKNGLYTKLAIASAMGGKTKYPDEPFMGFDEKPKLTDEEIANKKMEVIKENMMARMVTVNKRFKEKSGE